MRALYTRILSVIAGILLKIGGGGGPAYRPAAWEERFLTALTMYGTVTTACRRVGINPKRAYARRKRVPEFRKSWDMALETIFDKIEARVRQAEEEDSDGEDMGGPAPVSPRKPPDGGSDSTTAKYTAVLPNPMPVQDLTNPFRGSLDWMEEVVGTDPEDFGNTREGEIYREAAAQRTPQGDTPAAKMPMVAVTSGNDGDPRTASFLFAVIGAPIKHARGTRGMDIRELAERCSVSPGHIADIERGARLPSRQLLQRIGETLEYDFSKAVERFEDTPRRKRSPRSLRNARGTT